MSNRDIKKFLPPIFKTKEINNFLDSTSNKMFEEKKSEQINYYIGKKTGGVYSHLTDPYAVERTKLREDYQLDPALTVRDPQTGEVTSILYYEDLLNNLKSGGSFTDDQNRLFMEDVYSYAPPIDYDMFINYRDYYWMPEGAPAIEIDALPEDIIGNINFQGRVVSVDETLNLTTGNHIILNDGKEYIVDGVGEFIRLQEFDLSDNIPLRINRTFFDSSLSLYEKFPKEYITMERGAMDNNPWSRNNAWYHRDALFPNVTTRPTIKIERERRAFRPIIQYRKNIELHNYPQGNIIAVDVYHSGNTLPVDEIDNVVVFDGMTAIKKNSKRLYRFENNQWISLNDMDGKVAILNGRINKSREMIWSGSWNDLQQKTQNTQPIFFQMYDSSDGENVTTIDDGKSTIFMYKQDEFSMFDTELQIEITQRMSGDSSDFTFENTLRQFSIDEGISDVSYKKYNNVIDINDRLLTFTIGSYENKPTIFINGDMLPTLIVNANTPYVFDYSDSSTTGLGWFGEYFPITIVNSDGEQVIRPTHGHSKSTRVTLNYDIGNNDSVELFYRLETNSDIQGRIIVLPEIETTPFNYYSDYIYKGKEYSTLTQRLEIDKDGVSSIKLEYQPLSDDFVVMINGQDVEFTFEKKEVIVQDTKKGDLLEVYYSTRDNIVSTDNVIQEIPTALSNNSGNETPTTMTFSEMFNHFGSIIRNQKYLIGTPLGTNNYRDTSKDITKGEFILKHTAPILPLMAVNVDDEIGVLDAIENSNVFYTQYKNNIVLRTESIMRNESITPANTKDIFDNIITDMNSSKQADDSFSGTYMFASYRNYISITVDNDGRILQNIDLENDINVLYVYTTQGIMIKGIDYTVINDEGYTISPITFSLDEISVIRYYDDIQPTLCPATPAKFGIIKPQVPVLMLDDTYSNDVIMLVGHDNSRTLAYTTVQQFINGDIDGRDLVLLEFEKRIYNGISDIFKQEDKNVIEFANIIPGKFRNTLYNRKEYNSLEYERFFRWSTLNQTDYTTNISFNENDLFTYNYSYNVDSDGESLPGHWKGIFEYYYDTTMPHIMPWKMLGFDIKPTWFEDEYGSDYGSSNSRLWHDLEEGIIRHGSRENVSDSSYYNNNPYRREGLNQVIPVDVYGNLKNPVDIGITNKPTLQNAKKAWKYGDNSPVEQAWKSLSEYAFNKVGVIYSIQPALVTSRIWDTERTMSVSSIHTIPYHTYRVSGDGSGIVYGLTQWLYDLSLSSNLSPEMQLLTPFRNVQLNLAHKVGGFVNADEIRLFSESYNPESETLSTLMPQEDVTILTYQSKDIHNEAYSGVVVERVEASKSFYSFIDGYPYTNGDIIYSFEDNAYYKNNQSIVYNAWKSGIDYSSNDEVIFDNMIYVCLDGHTSSNSIRPGNDVYWKLKPFDSSEWAILIHPPKNNNTEFKIYGYNVRSPYFPISVPVNGGKKKSLSIVTSQSKQVNANEWISGQYYKRGHIVTYNSTYYEADVSHRSGNAFDSELWIKLPVAPMVGNVRVDFSTESSGVVEMVEYGQRFRTLDQVVEFLASYGRELVNRGWIFNDYDETVGTIKNWEYIIKEFVRWATDYRDVGSAITLSPFSTIANFKPKHGVVSLFNQYKASAYNLLDYRSAIIPSDTINVTRNNNVFTLQSPEPIYFLRLGIREYEHSISINNETIFGDSNYDPIIGVRKDRLRMSGTRSTDWNGTLHAAGYLVTENGIMPNFNTVSEEILAVNDMDSVATKDVMNELKYHNLGYQKRSYLENLEMADKSQINFYQGFIRQKGTSEAFQRLLRSNIIDANDALDVSEEWAFREGSFGSTYNTLQVEFNLSGNQFSFNPQNINLVYNGNQPSSNSNDTNLDITNGNEWIMKPTRFRDNGDLWASKFPSMKFKTAGYVGFDEHSLKIPNMKNSSIIMRNNAITPSAGITAWIAYNEMTIGSWDVLYLDSDTSFVGEIYNHGNDGENSAVVKAYNVDEDSLYIITHPDGFYNVKFRYIKDGYYIILSHNSDEYVTFNPNIIYNELEILKWKSLRITKDELNNVVPSIDEHLQDNEIIPTENMHLYRDGMNSNEWQVVQYINGSWNTIRTPREIVDTSLFNEVIAYDDNDEMVDYVRVFDPIQGMIPGSLLHMIDIISDIDPINYTEKEFSHSKYSQMVGTLWLDTTDLIYIDYHQGDNDYRTTHWGSMFPYCDVSVYEWVKSDVIPSDYDGDVINTTDYITQKIFDNNLGMYKTHYYFWVKNPMTISGDRDRTISANEISQSIKFPYNNGLPLINVIDNNKISINDNSRRLVLNDIVLRINYQYQHTNVPTHTQWTLLSESSDNDDVPDFIFGKMLDSIIGYTESLNPVPDINIPESSRYGTNAGQTWFKNIDNAREVFFTLVNEFITSLNVWDVELFWERLYGGIDLSNDYVSLVEWNDSSFNRNTIITSIVDNRVGVTTIPLFDGEYVKVIESPSNKPSMKNGGWTVYEYSANDDTYKKVAQSNATFKFNIDKILKDGIPEQEALNIRNILKVVFEVFAVRPYHKIINDVLFSMVRLVMAVQPNNNWLFPSTYISVRQELLNLVPKFMYMRDREDELRDYIREAKPYHTKLRDFVKINKPEDEYVAIKVTDFDKPPYIDEDKNFFILQERFIDTIKPIDGESTYTLSNSHTTNVEVTIGEEYVSPDQYRIVGRTLTFNEPPTSDGNYVESIIVQSDNMIHRDIINTWNPTYGYRLLDEDRSVENWDEFAINKHIQIHYDRNDFINTVSLEKIAEIYDHAYNETISPLAYIDSKSEFNVNEDEFLREIDRVLIHQYIDEVKNVVELSHYYHAVGYENYFIEIPSIDYDVLVFINDKLIRNNYYSIIQDGGFTVVRFKFEIVDGDYVVIRPKNEWLSLMRNASSTTGLNAPMDQIKLIPENSEFDYINIGSDTIMHETTWNSLDIVEFSHDDNSGTIITSGTFGNENNQYPEELSRLIINESMLFMSLNQMPPLVKMGYAGFNERDVQETIVHTIEEGVSTYPSTITVPAEQVKVIVNDDVLIPSIDYAVFQDRIELYTEQEPGLSLIITDLYVNFDPNYHNNVKRIKNINGGFDSFVFDYSRLNESPLTREFIVYGMNGDVVQFVTNEESFITVDGKPDTSSNIIDLNGTLNNSKNKLYAIVGYDEDESFDKINYEYEIVRGEIFNNQLTNMTRGLFNGYKSDFTDCTFVRVYELSVKDDLDEFVIQEAIVGETGRNSYPKYGSLFK